MKKALLIKLEAPSFSSIGMETAFREHYEVRSIDWQRIRFSGGLDGLKLLWNVIEQECISFLPDIIFCQFQKGEILNIEQWKRLSEFGFVINYTEDVREDVIWYEEVAPHIGLTIFTNEDDVEKMKLKGIRNVEYMPVSYNHLWYRPQPKTEKYYGDIIFIGNNYVGTNLNFPYAQERQDMIKFMKGKFGNKFQAYGLGQENQALSPAHCIEAYNNAKVVVGQNNFKRNKYQSDRGLNSMGCGAQTILQYFDGIREFFPPDVYLIHVWNNLEQLFSACHNLLEQGHIYSNKNIADYTLKKHSWLARIKTLNNLIKEQTVLQNN